MSIMEKSALGKVKGFDKQIDEVKLSSKAVKDKLKLSDVSAAGVENRGFTYYQAVLENPLDITYPAGTPIEIMLGFKPGECQSPKCLELLTPQGARLPFEWEEDTHPNPKKRDLNLATYSDGSLKFGKILTTIGDLAAKAKYTFTIKVYQEEQDITFPAAITKSIVDATPGARKEKLTVGNTEYEFQESVGWVMRSMKINGVEMISGWTAQRLSIKDNTSTSLDSMTTAARTNLQLEERGEGIIYKDYISTFQFAYNTAITGRIHNRVWKNGQLDTHMSISVSKALEEGVINEVNFKFATKLPPSGTAIKDTNGLKASRVADNAQVLLQAKHHQYVPDGTPTGFTYPGVNVLYTDDSTAGASFLFFLWAASSTVSVAVPEGAQYSAMVHYATNQMGLNLDDPTNIDNMRNKLMNRLVTTATPHHQDYLKDYLLSLCKAYLERNYAAAKAITNFPGLHGITDLAMSKLQGEDNIKTIIDEYFTKAMSPTMYGTASADDLYKAYQGDGFAKRGIEYIGRDQSSIPYLLKEAENNGYASHARRLIAQVHALADFYVKVEVFSGGGGKVKLQATTGNSDNMNAEAAAMVMLALSLKYEENGTRRACLDRIRSWFESQIQFKNQLPYSADFKTAIKPYSHYHNFSVYDYLHTFDNPTFHTTVYMWDQTTPSGATKELGYNWTNYRFGFFHTTLYAVAVLSKKGDISSLQQACRMMEYVISKCYPTGYHEYPMDGYVTNAGTIDQPIECQVVSSILLDEIL